MDQDDKGGRSPHHGRSGRGKEPDSRSMAARIGTSASGLVRETLQPSASTVASTLASSTASKGGSSPSTSFRSRAPDEVSNGRVPNGLGRSTLQESFRSRPWNGSNPALPGQQDINGFLSTSSSQLPLRDNQSANRNEPMWSTQEYWDLSDQSVRPSSRPGASMPSARNVGRDGDAVVALLSDPNFAVEDTPTDTFSISKGDNSAAYLFANTQFSNQDLQQFRSRLPAPATHGVPSPTNPLNLIPDFGSRRINGVGGATSSLATITEHSDESYLYHGIQPQSTPDYLEPWTEVLTRYQDDVWGDMLPLVQQAREEIKEAKSGVEGVLRDHPAVRRLGMILGHLEASGLPPASYDEVRHELRPSQADSVLIGHLNYQNSLDTATKVGEEPLSTEKGVEDDVGVRLQQDPTNQMDSQSTSSQSGRQFRQLIGGNEAQIAMARAERRTFVDLDKAAADGEARDRRGRDQKSFDVECNSSQNKTATAEQPDDSISDLEEEDHFIWYHRVDLRMSWAEVKVAYNNQFPQRPQEDFRSKQWKYYRCLHACGQPGTRQSDQPPPQEEHGMRARTGLWYPWMRGHWL